ILVPSLRASSLAFQSSASTSPQSPAAWRLRKKAGDCPLSVIAWIAPGVAAVLPNGNLLIVSSSVRLPVEVQPRAVLELQRPLLPVRSAPDHDEGCHEADDLELLAELGSVPDLAVLRLQRFPRPWLGVDLGQPLTSDGLGGVVHACLLVRHLFLGILQPAVPEAGLLAWPGALTALHPDAPHVTGQPRSRV